MGDLQSAQSGVDSTFRSEFLELRRWSLGLRRMTQAALARGNPAIGIYRFNDLAI